MAWASSQYGGQVLRTNQKRAPGGSPITFHDLVSEVVCSFKSVHLQRPAHFLREKGWACTFCWASSCGHFRQIQLAPITEEAGRRGSQGESFCPGPHSTGGPPPPSFQRAPRNVSTPQGVGGWWGGLPPPGPHTEACGGASIWLVGWICHRGEKSLIFCLFFLSSLFTCCPAGSTQGSWSSWLASFIQDPSFLSPPSSPLSLISSSLSFSLFIFVSLALPSGVPPCLCVSAPVALSLPLPSLPLVFAPHGHPTFHFCPLDGVTLGENRLLSVWTGSRWLRMSAPPHSGREPGRNVPAASLADFAFF